MPLLIVISLLALLAAGAAIYVAWRSRRTSHNLALEMVQLRDRFARMEGQQRDDARRTLADQERTTRDEGPDHRLADMTARLDAVEEQVRRAIELGESLDLQADHEAAPVEALDRPPDVRDLVRRGLRKQGYRRVYVLDITPDAKAVVEAERGGITAKGLAWIEPDGQVVMRSTRSHRAFP